MQTCPPPVADTQSSLSPQSMSSQLLSTHSASSPSASQRCPSPHSVFLQGSTTPPPVPPLPASVPPEPLTETVPPEPPLLPELPPFPPADEPPSPPAELPPEPPVTPPVRFGCETFGVPPHPASSSRATTPRPPRGDVTMDRTLPQKRSRRASGATDRRDVLAR